MPSEDRVPVIVGVGQVVERAEVVGAIDLAERAARLAIAEAPRLAPRIGHLAMVGILSATGRAPASELAARLGIDPARRETTTIGGNTPQWLVGRAAAAIAAGEVDTVLIAGAEAMRSERVLHGQGRVPNRTKSAEADPVVGDDRAGVGDAELAAGLVLPAHIYPMFESVLAARAGRSFAEHRQALGALLAPFTEVAAKHPCAWFSEVRRASDIATASPDNRLIAEPYTKRMNAVIGVDQGAALVVTSLASAREAGCAERAVFVWSSADANDVWYPTARPDPGSSPGLACAAKAALAVAGVGVDDVALIDLYSCFPVAVEIGAAAIGVALEDRRGFTLTGGLPYFGGPGNNYVTHAIATLVERLREQRGLGLLTGLGWYVTKHSVGLYGSEPRPAGFARGDTSAAQEAIDASALPLADFGEDDAGEGVVEAATVVYDNEGRVSGAPVIATVEGRRIAAACGASDGELQELAGVNLVGSRVQIRAGRPPLYQPSG
ncbi:MAG: acetyl-CoA acetyltransferase [Acidimicrobiales bacterium]